MPPPAAVPRGSSGASKYNSQNPNAYASMGSAGQALQQPVQPAYATHTAQHPPSKLATGGQSHAHRPVSAMPTPTDHSSSSGRSSQASSANASNVFASMNGTYNERRASAHPTMTSSHPSSGAGGVPPLPSAAGLDPNTASQALSSGIPITSPAALQYFAAHPRRQQVHFGNYLLLQTLGEGEFGKVKLGVHKEWGEEVAVKLIKRDKVGSNGGPLQLDGNKDPAKMSKVEREIQVLKDVRHPNIVRLYEVIESDRYIGIVLEYASGGELFDHILAHKFLKEEHACRLFAQLISGVSYLHQKKIVHRDLKLENLLLDRNRNVIITDFGFANNFEDKRDDLMATSCGSPCYAAPELVVQDGLYAGSAVDVWSCGVILYAMLAGYLPFDDDPANPDGDNINLLYKYIMATPLSFPDYITAQPRDLLSRMLVPDPLKRADLNQVMSHSWLASYRDLFRFSVDDLERAAMEQQSKKRQVYRQQMLYQQQMQEQQRRQQIERSQSTRHASAVGGPSAYVPLDTPQSTKAQRHHSAMATSTTVPDRMYEQPASGRSGSIAEPVPLGIPGTRVGQDGARGSSANVSAAIDPVTAQGNARGEPRTRLDETATASPSGSRKRDSIGNAKDGEYRKPAAQKAQRHTIQLEYGGSSERTKKDSNGKTDSSVPPVPRVTRDKPVTSRVPETDTFRVDLPKMEPLSSSIAAASSAITTQGSNSSAPTTASLLAEQKAPTSVPTDASMARTPSSTSAKAGIPSPILEQNGSPTTKSDAVGDRGDFARQRRPSAIAASGGLAANGGNAARGVSNPLPAAQALSFPPSGERVVSAGAGPNPEARSRSGSRPSTSQVAASNRPTPERTNSRHRKGMSTDKFFLSRLLGTPSQSSPSSRAGGDEDPRRSPGERPADGGAGVGSSSKGSTSSRRKAMSLVVGRPGDVASPASRDRERAVEANGKGALGTDKYSKSEAAAIPPGPSVQPKASNGSSHMSRPATGSMRQPTGFYDESTIGSSSTAAGPSSSAAKKVMDWFRKKSLSRGAFNEQPPLGPFERAPVQLHAAPSSPGAPQLLAANTSSSGAAGSSVPSSRSTSGTHSQTSEVTQATQLTATSEPSERNSDGLKSSASTVQQATPKASSTMVGNGPSSRAAVATGPLQPSQQANLVNLDARLRFHLGAVDQSALTSRSPVEVFEEVQRSLFDMGIEARKEKDEDFKLECVRRKRPKTLMSATQGLGLSIRTSVFPPSQADVERSSRTSNALSPSPSTPAGSSIRSFLRRGSQQSGVTSPRAGSAVLSPSATSSQIMDGPDGLPPPLYGDASVDGGQEIRFSVEVTKIKNLPGLYSLDIRRMKGNLWAYKFVYHALLDRCQLGSSNSLQPGIATAA